MTTAIIGVGNIGSAVARHLTNSGEPVVLTSRDNEHAAELANELGTFARTTTVGDAIASADAVIFAIWLDTIKEVIPRYATSLEGKVVVDPSNPLAFDETGQPVRSLPADQSAGSIVAGLLPASAHYVKAFGTLGVDALAGSSHRTPKRAALLYATDDDKAATEVERLIRSAGFDPLKVGGLESAGRIEAPEGDLHQFGFKGAIVDIDEARAALAARPSA